MRIYDVTILCNESHPDMVSVDFCCRICIYCMQLAHDINVEVSKHTVFQRAVACVVKTAMVLQGQRYHQEASWICEALLCCPCVRAS